MLSPVRVVHARRSIFHLTAAHPNRIDLCTSFTGPNISTTLPDKSNPWHTRGIYKRDGNRLIYCIGEPNAARPNEFATRAGDKRTLVVLRRVDAKK